jgi:hypothetical protein
LAGHYSQLNVGFGGFKNASSPPSDHGKLEKSGKKQLGTIRRLKWSYIYDVEFQCIKLHNVKKINCQKNGDFIWPHLTPFPEG